MHCWIIQYEGRPFNVATEYKAFLSDFKFKVKFSGELQIIFMEEIISFKFKDSDGQFLMG